MLFSTSTDDFTDTRAGSTTPMDDAQMRYTGFGVFAYYTGESNWNSVGTSTIPNFMYNQQITWGAIDALGNYEWQYTPLKYWPNDNQPADDEGATGSQAHSYVSFFAYAPYVDHTTDLGSTGITNFTSNSTTGDPKVTYVLAAEPANQVDLLWGTRGKSTYHEADGTPNTESVTVNTDLTKQTTTERVDFLFKHALACIDIYVQRIYDEVLPTGKTPDTEATKIFVNELKLTFPAKHNYTSGELNLATGIWDITDDDSNPEKVFTVQGDLLASTIRGTGEPNSNLPYVQAYELENFNDNDKRPGVISTPTRLTHTSYATMLLPRDVTFTPSVSYSFVTRDNELALNDVTASDGTHFSRILHKDVTGSPVTITLEKNKRYTLICYIGAESVRFEVTNVEDWDFPIRLNSISVTATTTQTFSPTVNED